MRGELTEAGVIQSLRDIHNHYHELTGESYIKSRSYGKNGVFLLPESVCLTKACNRRV